MSTMIVLLLICLSLSLVPQCVSLEKTYGIDDEDIPKIEQAAVIEALERHPELGAEVVDGFLDEAFSSWNIMKRKYRRSSLMKTVEEDFGKYLSICLNRYMAAVRLLPSPKLEERALSALASRESNARERNKKRKKKMLCTVFLSGYETDLDILDGNLNATQGLDVNVPHCEWLIIFFGGDNQLISKFYSETGTGVDILNGHASLGVNTGSNSGNHSTAQQTRSSTYSHVVAAFDYRGPRAVSGADFTPKQMWYPIIVPYLEQYQRVWLLDADISLKSFDFDYLQWTFDCTNWSKSSQVHDGVDNNLPRGPIISQPLVLEDTQYYYELNYGSYHLEPRKMRGRRGRQGSLRKHRHLLAYRTKVVEQQAPIFHADFFEWYATSLVKPWLPIMLTMESTWGFDTTWCGAAETYIAFKRAHAPSPSPSQGQNQGQGRRMLSSDSTSVRLDSGRGSGGPCYGCAVLIRSSPISHVKSSKRSGMRANKHGSPLAVAVFYMTGHLTKKWVHSAHKAWSKYLEKGNGLGRPTMLTGIPRSALRAANPVCSSTTEESYYDKHGKGGQRNSGDVDSTLNRTVFSGMKPTHFLPLERRAGITGGFRGVERIRAHGQGLE